MNCDRIAGVYRWLEYSAFGGALARRRFCFLADVAAAKRALVLGDGDGRFLARFAAVSRAAVDYVDSSAHMLKLARSRAGSERIVYHHADALTIPLRPGEYDLIATHFFLDCFNASDLQRMVERVHEAAQPGALWLISEFRRPMWAAPLIAVLYLFFRLTADLRVSRLTDHRPLLHQHGFRLLREETSRRGLLVTELWVAPTSPNRL